MSKRDDNHAALLGEKAALERMISETPSDDVIDLATLRSRLAGVDEELARTPYASANLARVRVTFRGKPVVGSHGILAEFGTRAINTFVESIAAMAASLTAPLAATGPIPNRGQHQLLITNTVPGSFGFDLEEHATGQLHLTEESAVSQALDRTQSLLQGTLGSDDELADSVIEPDARAIEKIRAFLQTVADSEAYCTVRVGDSVVRFDSVAQVQKSISRLGTENLTTEQRELSGEFWGVLPRARTFEFKVASSDEVIKGRRWSTRRR